MNTAKALALVSLPLLLGLGVCGCGSDSSCEGNSVLSITGGLNPEFDKVNGCGETAVIEILARTELDDLEGFGMQTRWQRNEPTSLTLRILPTDGIKILAAENIGKTMLAPPATVRTRIGEGYTDGSLTITAIDRDARTIDLEFEFDLSDIGNGPSGKLEGSIEGLELPYDL